MSSLGDGGDSSGTGRPADHAVVSDHGRKKIQIQVVPQKSPAQAAGPDVLLGEPVVAGEGEVCIGCRAVERDIDDVLDARSGGCVDERAVLIDPVRSLRSGHHEHGPHAVESPPTGPGIAVLSDRDLSGIKPGCPGRVPDDEALLHVRRG